MNRYELKLWAKKKLKGNVFKILGALFIAGLFSSVKFKTNFYDDEGTYISFAIDFLRSIINVGLVTYMVNFVNDKEAEIGMLFSQFKKWWKIILTNFLSRLFIVLYTFLFIIPGIVRAFSMSLLNYLLADDKYNDKSATELIELSKVMMNGHKMDLFLLNLSFIGWHILAIFTFGILEVWVLPYQVLATTKFLNDIKTNYENNINGTPNNMNNNYNYSNNTTITTNYCPQCGNKVNQENNFCGNCGAKL